MSLAVAEPCEQRQSRIVAQSRNRCASDRRLPAVPLWLLCDMTLNVLHLLSPTAVIHAPCLKFALAGDFVEAGLGKQQQCAACGFLESEFDKRGRLLRIVYFWVHGVRVPREGKQPLGFHCLYYGLPFEVLVTGIGNVAARDLTGHKWAIQFHTKPLAKLTIICQGTPDPRNRRFELDAFFNMIVHSRNLQVA